MSETFKQLQESLRSYKSKYDIDLTSPRGVFIGGKMYPAIHKHLEISMKGRESPEDLPSAHFDIPFENGLRAQMQVYDIDEDKGISRVNAYLNVPYTYQDIVSGPQHSFVFPNVFKEGKQKQDDIHVNVSNLSGVEMDKLHRKLKDWSETPRFGIVLPTDVRTNLTSPYSTERYIQAYVQNQKNATNMSEQDLSNHLKNYVPRENYEPHNITVYEMGYDRGYKHHYNVVTEQLKKVDLS